MTGQKTGGRSAPPQKLTKNHFHEDIVHHLSQKAIMESLSNSWVGYFHPAHIVVTA